MDIILNINVCGISADIIDIVQLLSWMNIEKKGTLPTLPMFLQQEIGNPTIFFGLMNY